MRRSVAAAMLWPAVTGASASTSVLQTMPDDPRAVLVHGRGDGRTDDTAAIQSAIDSAAKTGAGGIVFLPSGRYRISRTLIVWPAVRVYGIGATRPVLVLGPRTPGFARGLATMVVFAGAKPDPAVRIPVPVPGIVPSDRQIADANSGTFYSAMNNVDVAIGRGNTAAVAVRFHAAQHGFLSHMDFDLGSGLAGIYQVGNFGEDLHFRGGRYGILTEKTSPAWQYTLVDSAFEGQRDAAIREHEAGLTLVNVGIRDVPVGIDIDKGYGDQLWGRNVRFENVSRAGVVISNEASAFTQIGFEDAVASRTPVFARFRESGRAVAGKGATYRVMRFSYGLHVPDMGQIGATALDSAIEPLTALPPVTRAIPPLPLVSEWANARALGAKGDNATDDTAALQRAIDAHRTVYLPSGRYRVSDTLRLRADTRLVSLHPGLTWISLAENTAAYQGLGAPKPLVESATGGDAIVSGIGLSVGGINPRATALLWRAGANSLVSDVKIQGGGHGTDLPDGTRFDPYNADRSGDPDPAKRWHVQPPSIWVTDGGGGTFADIWSPSTYATAGFAVTNTDTPGHVYQLSAEHHVRSEIRLDHVSHWEFLAPQTEEEAGESGDAASFTISDVHDVLLANYHGYRVTRSRKPAPAAIELFGDNDLRLRNVHVNAESGFAFCDAEGCGTYLRASRYPFENALRDRTRGLDVREREFAALDVRPAPAARSAIGMVTKLADGFTSASGGAIGPNGTLYFVDHGRQRIYRWSAAGGLGLVRSDALDAVNLMVDGGGKLLVLSSAGAMGTVLSLDPEHPGAAPMPIEATASSASAASLALPSTAWINGEFRDQLDPATLRYPTLAALFARGAGQAHTQTYRSPDGSLALPAYRVIQQGPPTHGGWRFSDALDANGLVVAKPGARTYVVNGAEDRTYSARVGRDGSLTDLQPFANRGGESVAVGADGRVYIANGQVFVYAADGHETGRIDVPDRPLQLLFGGLDGRTLFILTHHALYAAIP